MAELVTETVGGELYQYYPLGEHVVRAIGVCSGRPTFKYTRIEITGTLERLAVQTSSRPLTYPRRRVPGWLMGVGWAAAVLLAVAGGLGAANLIWPAPPAPQEEPAEVEALLARNLRVIENKRLYENADDLEFLRGLDQPDLFGDDTGW